LHDRNRGLRERRACPVARQTITELRQRAVVLDREAGAAVILNSI